jgi:hypothetical protein
MRLWARIRRWWRPPERRADHPLDAGERAEEATHPQHWWEHAQEVGGANAWGSVDAERDFEPRPRM